jgi:hypothetical protein
MAEQSYGCEFRVDTNDGRSVVDVVLASVEEKFIGLSLTRHDGPLEVRRVGVEIRDIEQIKAMAEALGHYIARHG